MRIKLKKKLNDTFIFWQREEREKKQKKKIYQSPTTMPLYTRATPIERAQRDAYNATSEKQHLDIE